MKTAKSKSPKQATARHVVALPMRTAVDAIRMEMRRAAEVLGFDTARKDWMKLALEDSNGYPFLADEDEACVVRLLPRRVRCGSGVWSLSAD